MAHSKRCSYCQRFLYGLDRGKVTPSGKTACVACLGLPGVRQTGRPLYGIFQ